MSISRLLPVLIIFKLFERGNAFLLERYHLSLPAASMQSFDFSSATEWDEFYKKSEKDDTIASEGGSTSTETTATEWHSSISLDEIASVVPPNGKCLIIGCGNSKLPDTILKQQNRPRSLVLLDTSQTCLDQLRERYQSMESFSNHFDGFTSEFPLSNIDIKYVCGDVTQLSNYFDIDNIVDSDESAVECKGGNNSNTGSSFDIIIDKGLTDAILCGEGWDGPLEKLLYESAKILAMDTGRYLLISYELPSSTKEFLVNVGYKVGLEWDFDFDLATSASSSKKSDVKYQRVSVAMARKKNKIIL